jgi:hypothetical protein
MNDEKNVGNAPDRFLAAKIDGFDSLPELTLDMRCSWNHATDGAWRKLDPIPWV